jgi:hypothetical protein
MEPWRGQGFYQIKEKCQTSKNKCLNCLKCARVPKVGKLEECSPITCPSFLRHGQLFENRHKSILGQEDLSDKKQVSSSALRI